jgi:hypothetical protein
MASNSDRDLLLRFVPKTLGIERLLEKRYGKRKRAEDEEDIGPVAKKARQEVFLFATTAADVARAVDTIMESKAGKIHPREWFTDLGPDWHTMTAAEMQLRQIDQAREFIHLYVTKRSSSNGRGSYTWKHIAETYFAYSPEYVSEKDFVVAMVLQDYYPYPNGNSYKFRADVSKECLRGAGFSTK